MLYSGSKPLTDLNTELELSLEDPEYSTLGGYLFGQLGRLPRVGDRVAVGADLFEITDMDNRRVKTVRYLPGAAPGVSAETAVKQ